MDEKYNNLIIAIDGYSSSGKSTLAKDLAKVLNYKYIDSGAMYRAVTLIAIENGFVQEDRIDFSSLLNKINNLNFDFKFNPKKNRFEVYLNKICIEDKIRDLRIADKVSLIAKIKVIREKLVKLQRQFGSKGAIVMDGRDIGTVVFPNADLKIFMTANIKIRAQRRFFELKNESPDITIDNVIENIKKIL